MRPGEAVPTRLSNLRTDRDYGSTTMLDQAGHRPRHRHLLHNRVELTQPRDGLRVNLVGITHVEVCDELLRASLGQYGFIDTASTRSPARRR